VGKGSRLIHFWNKCYQYVPGLGLEVTYLTEGDEGINGSDWDGSDLTYSGEEAAELIEQMMQRHLK
jgi:hypothetical protein